MTALAQNRPQLSPRSREDAAKEGPGQKQSGGMGKQARFGNEFMKDRLASNGPFSSTLLNGALGAAFGQDLGALGAAFGESDENDAIGAKAHTSGKKMSFGSSVKENAGDSEAMEVIAHETAHALADGGSGEKQLDEKGDAGERSADDAGKRFGKWAERGFDGPVPKLHPAKGGKARTHRVATTTLTGTPLLRHGSSGALVRILQSLLNGRGASLKVDGAFGDKTDNAVRAFQRREGLNVDGCVGPKTASALNGGTSSKPAATTNADTGDYAVDGSPMLRSGSSGALVTALQKLLNKKGGSLSVDGAFGQKTDTAVRDFQSANHLEVDGIVGKATAASLNDRSSKNIAAVTSSATPYAGNDAYDNMRDAVLDAAKSHLGAPYYWGADGPSMFDCSGFILYVLRQDTGLVSWGDDTAGGIKGRVASTNNPQKGDLIFYTGSSGVSHIEMYTGSGTTEIGASGGGSSTFGHDPDAKVQYGNYTADSRSRSYGSISKLIAAQENS